MIYLAIFLFFFFIGACVAYEYRADKRILPPEDPNVPLTSTELRAIGIIPPERYDEWLDEFARR
jgi:hypothetical protein